MKILSLRLRGAIGLLKGQKLDEIYLDLSNVSGLCAFDGPNGKGKSTILENLSPYPTLASRKGALFHHFGLRDSFRDLTFSFDGDEIRTLIKIDCQSEKTEGFVWVNGNSKVDGKISSYKEFMNELLGSPNLFFNSVFCAQNSNRISDMTTGELKGLFSEFLRLDRLVQYESTSKQCSNVLNGKLDSANRTIEKLNENLSKLNEVEKGLKVKEYEAEKSNSQILIHQGALVPAEKELQDLKDILPKNQIALQRIADLGKSKTSIEKARDQDKEDMNTELSKLRATAQKISGDAKACEKLLEDREAIENAVKEDMAFDKDLATLRPAIDKSNDTLTKFTAKINEKRKIRTEYETTLKNIENDTEAALLEAEIKSLKEQALTLEERKNDPGCPAKEAICIFVSKAYEASQKIPGIEKALHVKKTALQESKERAEKDLATLKIQIKELTGQEIQERDLLDSYKKRVAGIGQRQEGLNPLIAQADQVKEAATKLKTLKERKQELIDEGLKVKASWEKRILENESLLTETDRQIEAARAEIDENVESKIKEIEGRLDVIKKDIEKEEKDLQTVKGEILVLETKIIDMETQKQELDKAEAEKTSIIKEIGEWHYLKNACSKTGLQALEIDAVAPTIMHYANDLTTTAFGPDCTIKLCTQDDEGKEIFDIKIIDEDGEEVLLSNRSGGQKVWPLKALRLAMARISKEKSGRNFQTLLSDEEDGPLSLENAKKFVSLYRAIITPHKTTGERVFEDCFYISHKPECVAMADNRIVFNSGIRVE